LFIGVVDNCAKFAVQLSTQKMMEEREVTKTDLSALGEFGFSIIIKQ